MEVDNNAVILGLDKAEGGSCLPGSRVDRRLGARPAVEFGHCA
jgi:hypothetical protein